MIFIATWWKALVGAGTAFLLAYAIHHIDIARLELKRAAQLSAQQTLLEAKCSADKKKTEELLNDLRKKTIARDSHLNAQRLQPSKCIAYAPASAAGDNGATPRSGPTGQTGLPAGSLYEYAYQNQMYYDRLGACQEYLKAIK